MISTHVSRVSAWFLLAGGLILLFAPDVVLPRLVPGLPPTAAWVGQLLAAACLALATLNWHSRSLLLGGIYGRSVVETNAMFYFVAATVLLNRFVRFPPPLAGWLVVTGMVPFAAVYAWLLFRGPFARDLEMRRARGGLPG